MHSTSSVPPVSNALAHPKTTRISTAACEQAMHEGTATSDLLSGDAVPLSVLLKQPYQSGDAAFSERLWKAACREVVLRAMRLRAYGATRIGVQPRRESLTRSGEFTGMFARARRWSAGY